MAFVTNVTGISAGWVASLCLRVSRGAAERFGSWYGKQSIRHPNFVGPIRWERTVRTAFGAVMKVNFQEMLGRKLILGESHEPELTERIRGALRPGDVFVDVGANIGYYTLLASRMVGEGGLVMAFEPSHPNLACLARNVTLSECRNVLVLSEALSDHVGVHKLSLPWAINSGVASLGNGPSANGPDCFAAGYTLTIARPLDDILPGLPLCRPVRVIKVDAEGHEPEVIRGMEKLLRHHGQRYLACELSPENYDVAALCEYLRSLGYQGEYYSGNRWRPIASNAPPRGLCNAWFWRD